jgi:hypothetical protein
VIIFGHNVHGISFIRGNVVIVGEITIHGEINFHHLNISLSRNTYSLLIDQPQHDQNLSLEEVTSSEPANESQLINNESLADESKEELSFCN